MRALLSITAALVLVGVVTTRPGHAAAASTSPPPADLAAIMERFLNRAEPPLVQYRAWRRLQARNDRFDAEGWLEAWTELDPAGGFRYTIVAEGGSSSVIGRVLRPTLEGEARACKSGEGRRASLSAENYEFEPTGLEPDGLIKVTMKPRRREGFLVNGAIFVTADKADLVRIEGTLVKPPSFWTRHVDLVRRYDRIAGVSVPVLVESTAKLRIAGFSSFMMSYEYETINGQQVDSSLRASRQQ